MMGSESYIDENGVKHKIGNGLEDISSKKVLKEKLKVASKRYGRTLGKITRELEKQKSIVE